MNPRPHIVVLHRWRDTYAAVSHVGTEAGAAGVPAAGDVAVVAGTDQAGTVDAEVHRLGWLPVPAPVQLPFRIEKATSIIGRPGAEPVTGGVR